MNAKPASHLLGAPHDPKANHIRCAIFLALLAALLLFTCQAWGPLDNPTDPKSATYQGYDTVTNPAAIAAALPADKGSLSGSTLTATKVTGATAYELRIAASAADLDTACPLPAAHR